MSLIYPAPPFNVALAFWNGMKRYLSGDDPLSRILASPSGGQWRIHCLYLLGLQEIIDGKDFQSAAVPTGWRFLLSGAGGEAAAGYVTVRDPEPRMTSLGADQKLKENMAYATAIDRIVEESPELSGKDYELRLLSIPCLLMEVFWLVPPAGGPGHDLVFPYKTLVDELRPQMYTVEQFLAISRPLAEERQAADGGVKQHSQSRYGWPPDS